MSDDKIFILLERIRGLNSELRECQLKIGELTRRRNQFQAEVDAILDSKFAGADDGLSQ